MSSGKRDQVKAEELEMVNLHLELLVMLICIGFSSTSGKRWPICASLSAILDARIMSSFATAPSAFSIQENENSV